MKAIQQAHAAAAAAVLILALAPVIRAQHTSSSHASTLGAPRVDRLADQTVVVSLVATGELRGLITLNLRPSGSGSYDGTWAFTVAHVDNSDPETGIEPTPHPHDGDDPEGHPHKDFVRLVQRGSLAGAISGAVLTFDSAGALTALAAPLSISQGAGEFEGAAGSGSAALTDLTLVF